MISLRALRRKWWWPFLTLPILYGTIGFRLIEGWSWTKSFYMTMITISTVGFDDGGMGPVGKAFTTSLIFFGVGAFLFVISYVVQEFAEQTDVYERRTRQKFRRMKNHYIICGAGRVGREMAERLKQKKVPFVVVENNSETLEALKNDEIPYIAGDATDEDTLKAAGVERAKSLACVLESDADNVFVALTARVMNPDLYIVARANSNTAASKLLKAGANRVLNPFSTTATRMVTTLLKPTVTDFLEVVSSSEVLDLAIEEILIPAGSALDGRKIADSQIRQKENVIVTAIQKKGGTMVFNPPSDEIIQAGDVLICLGSYQALESLEKRIRVTS